MVELDAKELRAAFGSYMTGVTIVTARARDGEYVGFTANSFTSVSLAPPLLLVCPGKHLSSFDVFNTIDHFAVNILAEDQETLSNRFASSKGDRFDGTDWKADLYGSPIIEGVAAHFSCSTFNRIDAGDHIILIGEVKAFQNNPRKGLGYSSSGYFNLNQQLKVAHSTTRKHRFFVGAVVECDDHLLIQDHIGQLGLPVIEAHDRYRAPLAIAEHLRDLGCHIDVRQTYSVFDDPSNGDQYMFFRATARSLDAGGAGRYIPIADLNPDNMGQPGTSSMMQRFKSEFHNQNFGLFIGNTETGDVSAAL